MTRGRKTGGKNFLPGELNAGGRPRKDVGSFSIKTRNQLEKLLKTYMEKSLEDLQAIINDPKLRTIDHWIARVVIAGIKGGDTQRLNFMFENTYGKLTERKEIVLPKPTIIERLDGSQMLLGAEIVDAESEDNDA